MSLTTILLPVLKGRFFVTRFVTRRVGWRFSAVGEFCQAHNLKVVGSNPAPQPMTFKNSASCNPPSFGERAFQVVGFCSEITHRPFSKSKSPIWSSPIRCDALTVNSRSLSKPQARRLRPSSLSKHFFDILISILLSFSHHQLSGQKVPWMHMIFAIANQSPSAT